MDRNKAVKALGQLTVDEMDTMALEALGAVVVQAATAMKQAKEELEANPQYIELKASLDACSQGKRELDARQKARIAYALDLIEEKGK